ncbi:MAG: hypothetical protein BM564_02755 [Bacteroidetes bacterium MedPE-SWsnd-G2]|nr:MAG: hypothetical protein BM564_02755 [Bacteroidetes bacterium MedPE-SWsnd-G2]
MRHWPILFVCVFIWSCSNSSKNESQKSTSEIDLKVEALIEKMTLKEKVGQMLNIGLPLILEGDYWSGRDSAVFHEAKFKSLITDYGVGSIHNTPSYPAQAKEWQKIVKTIQDSAIANSRHGIPVIYGIDNIHGANYVRESVMFPHQIGVAGTWNTELSKKVGEITSYESRAASLPWNYNPNIDVASNPLWGRIAESFGEDPYLISKMGAAYIEGSQLDGLNNQNSTAVCVKHYLGYGAGRNGKDRANAILPERVLRQYYLPPFKAAIEQGAKSVMISSNAVNGIPCHINSYYINDILKGELGFEGVVISDFSDVEFLIEAHQSATNMKDATKMAVNAGLDMIMNPYDADIVDIIIELVEEEKIAMSRINDAASRILKLKYELNLFEKPYNDSADFPELGGDNHMASNYNVASESITLLKNKDRILPLGKDKKVLVTGYASNSLNVLNGAWSRSFLGTDTRFNDLSKQTIKDAIANAIGEKQLSFVQGTDYTQAIDISKAVEKAKTVDYIVACVGEMPATEKPSDINSLELPEAQKELIKALSKLNKPIILVLIEGRPRLISDIEPLVDAIVMGYLPGQEGGRAISDVIFGDINPSGKLPYTYPKYSGNTLPYYHKKTDIRDVNWGYNGFYPQFEFGHGLSYTTFEFSDLVLNSDKLKGEENLTISITVNNTGNRAGKEVVQLYLKDLVARVSPDSKRLIGFQKIEIEASTSKTVSFSISKEQLSHVGMGNKWIVEDGDFELQIGTPGSLLTKTFTYKN